MKIGKGETIMKHQTGRRKFLRLLPMMALCLWLTACSRENAQETIEKAQESLQNITSMSYDIGMDMEMSGGGQTVAMSTTASADYIMEPAQMKLDMEVSMNGMGGMGTSSYLVEENGVYTLYTGISNGSQTYWQVSEMENMDSYSQYNAEANLELYLSCAESFQKNGEELIGETKTVRYDGIIAGDALSQVIKSSGISAQMAALGLDETMSDSMFEDLKDLPISIWIAEDTYIPMKYEMDMTDLMQSMMTGIMSGLGEESAGTDIRVNKVFVSMTIHNINNVTSIEVPKDALAAGLTGASGLEDTTRIVPGELNDQNYQSFFQPAQDLGYQYVGRTYCKAPTDMLGEGAFLTAYLPYGDALSYSDDGLTVWSSAHGMQVSQTSLYTEGNAQTVVDQAYQELVNSGLNLIEPEIGETQYNTDYDISYKQIAYYEEVNGETLPRVAILYADYKQPNYYLYAQITYMPEQFDDQYPAMLNELSDAFALSLPQFALSQFY